MLASSPGRGRPAAVRLAAAAATSVLTGCTDGPASAGAWWFVSLSLGLVATLAYLVGAQRARIAARREAPTVDALDPAVGEAPGIQAQADALGPLLAVHEAPALLAAAEVAGDPWRVQQFNAAAQSLWPGLREGTPLADLLQGLPTAVQAAVTAAGAAQGPPTLVAGWHVVGSTGQRGAARLLVIAQRSSAGAAGPAGPADLAPGSEADSFSFTVSHDLRAPIRVVEGFTRIVKEDYGRLLDRVGNDHLDRVLGAAARMNLMIDALLTLARLSSQPLARQRVNLSQLAGWVVDDLRRGAPEREVTFEIEPDLSAQGDPTLLRLVLENLLGNAWKYSARCSHARISLHVVAHGAGQAFEVRDNGAGFDMRSADRLFGLFQRLHSASEFPGHGVGLASVQRIVRRHGGAIWAEAEPGRGAAFFFTLAP